MADNMPRGDLPPTFTGMTVQIVSSGDRWHLTVYVGRSDGEGGRRVADSYHFRVAKDGMRGFSTYPGFLAQLGALAINAAWEIHEVVEPTK